jgi:uncharacterized protein YcfL
MIRKMFISGAVVLMAGLLASCRTPSSGIVVESYPKTQIAVNSKVLGSRVQVQECNFGKRNELLQAQMRIQNVTQKDMQFEYRFRWVTKDGMEVASGMSTWLPVSIRAKETALINAIAPNKEVEDMIWDLRFVRPSTIW